jgi:hypothetical protein
MEAMLVRMVVAACLAALTACNTAAVDIPAEERKPDLVKTGMSVRQVEGLMGPHNNQPCWDYETALPSAFAFSMV